MKIAALFLALVLGLHAGAAGLHDSLLVIDGHNDLPWAIREAGGLAGIDLKQPQPKFNTDIPRLRQGNVGAQFWSAYVPASTMKDGTAVKTTLEQIDLIHKMVAAYPDTFQMALTPDEIRSARANGKIASLIGIEGGHSIDNSLVTLRDLFAKGARYMTLSHSKNLDWVESATDTPMPDALTAFGKDVVREMNKLGMLVDISHISARAMREVLAVATAPVIASHSSAWALKNHPRNVPDDVLHQVRTNGGVIMVNFYPAYISDRSIVAPPLALNGVEIHDCVAADFQIWNLTGLLPVADTKTVVDHIEHIIRVAGINHVGLGSDFDGVPLLPMGLEEVSKYPNITLELQTRGYLESDIRKIMGENLMRAFEEAQRSKTR
jgi:membrane dipeptidase